jgi:hypothetical protein
MRIWTTSIPRASGHTFRRHFPIWIGKLYHNDKDGRRLIGGYVRIKDTGYFASRSWPYKASQAAWQRRLSDRVTKLEQTTVRKEA